MNNLFRHKYNNRLIRQFLHLIKSVEDTPTLIQSIAENKYFLIFCSYLIKSKHSKDFQDHNLKQALYDEIRNQKISHERLIIKLTPVASSLGLRGDSSDSFQKDFYQVLGVKTDSTVSQIKKAFRDKARLVHPDMPKGEADDFINIQEAYNALSNISIRKQYDLSRSIASHEFWHEDDFAEGKRVFSTKKRYVYSFAAVLFFLVMTTFIADIVHQELSFDDNPIVKQDKQISHPSKDEIKNSPFQINKADMEPSGDNENSPANPSDGISEQSLLDANVDSINRNHRAELINKTVSPYQDKDSASKSQMLEKEFRVKKTFDRNKTRGTSEIHLHETGSNKEKEIPAADNAEEVKIIRSVILGTEKKDNHDSIIENRACRVEQISEFLKEYCRVYESKNLDGFMAFFSKNAKENGQPLKTLSDKYKKNFETLDNIFYLINMKNYVYDLSLNKLQIDGAFNLRWQKKNEHQWHSFRGVIQMDLIYDEKKTLLIEQLNYTFQ